MDEGGAPRSDAGGGGGGGDDGWIDAGPVADAGPRGSGCTAVDILFVIDNSASMCSRQQALAEAFPSFADAMFSALPSGIDLHVGITTSSFCTGGGHAENNCVANESAAEIAAVFQPASEGVIPGNGYQGRLLEHGGKAYFTADTGDSSSKDALSDWFAAAATSVGCSGCAFDFTVAAAGDLVAPANATANAGFLRDEGAVLLIFVLTDEASHEPAGVAPYRDALVAAKAGCGGEQCIITGGLLSTYCATATPPPLVWSFLSSFGNEPVWGSIGGVLQPAPDYTAVVGDALAQFVTQTCDEIIID